MKDKAHKQRTQEYPGKPNREKPNKPSYKDNSSWEQREEERERECLFKIQP